MIIKHFESSNLLKQRDFSLMNRITRAWVGGKSTSFVKVKEKTTSNLVSSSSKWKLNTKFSRQKLKLKASLDQAASSSYRQVLHAPIISLKITRQQSMKSTSWGVFLKEIIHLCTNVTKFCQDSWIRKVRDILEERISEVWRCHAEG